MAKKSKALRIDMCAGSELMDTQSETLSVDGCDISELKLVNDNHGKGAFNSIGYITESKKIFKAEDCQNDRHKYYWDKIKAPYIYAAGYLHDSEDHPNARAAAAIIKNIHREDTPLSMKASVEGGVLARGIKDPNRLARTKIHSVALTFTPANNATLVEPLDLDKSSTNWEADKQLIKSVMHLAQTNIPSFRHVTRHASANSIHDNILKIQDLAKSLGIDITVNESNPDKIMKQAVYHKLSNNVNKINDLVKAIKLGSSAFTPAPAKAPTVTATKAAEKVKASDTYQQNISQLKEGKITPTKPKDAGQPGNFDATKVQSAEKVKHINTLKTHASHAMKDPNYLKTLHSDLTSRSIPDHQVNKIISGIKTHMVEPKLEKGLGKLAAGAAIIAGVTAFTPKADKATLNRKPASESKVTLNRKPKNPDVKVNTKAELKQKKINDHHEALEGATNMKELSEAFNPDIPGGKAKFLQRRKALREGLSKALTAGYGGAGSPTSMTGGSVLQSEALDDGRTKKSETTDGFSYISCNDCGSDQVYMAHQVKCRKCKKNFSLEKLQNHM